jgi:Ca2+-binding RTX toxin-like protein
MKTTLRTKPALAGLLTLVALGASAVPASAALPQVGGAVDLANWRPNSVADGASSSDQTGSVLARAGDVNGDGLGDFVVAAQNADPYGRRDAGTAFVVFGRADNASIDLARIASGGGFRIDGAVNSDRLGSSVARAGDMNGDGLADLIVGAREADNRGRSASGSAYVVFGKPTSNPVDVANLGSQGFRIDGPAAGDRAASSVSGAGDVNGDGRPDVMLGAPLADRNGRTNSGAVFVIFGKGDVNGVDIAALGGAGYEISGAAPGDQLSTVASVRDIDADGRTDVFVGARFADAAGRLDAGAAYVVPGQGGTTRADLSVPAASSYKVHGGAAADGAGAVLAQGGDVNGDGSGDLLLGAPGADNNGRSGSGSAYVLLDPAGGGTNDLRSATSTWRIDGAAPGDAAGSAIDATADVDSDGRTDMAVGSPFADRPGGADAGSVRVLFGGGWSGSVDLASTGARGYRVTGGRTSDWAGSSVAFTNDFNGDGRSELVVGAPQRDHNGRGNSGSAYLLFGWGQSDLDYPSNIATTVGQPIAPLGPEAIVRTGPVSFSIAPALPAGLTLDARTGVISGAPTDILEQPATFTLTMTDLAGSVAVPVTLRVAPAPGRCANRRSGSGQADTLVGTSGGDVIEAGAGNDNVQGVAGDDCILGDVGVDTLAGGDGADELRGGTEHDVMDGGPGDDQVHGDAGQDTLSGADGADALVGGTGFDDLDGGAGNDKLLGQADSDSLAGGDGNDRIEGGDSADRISGGRGDDVLLSGAANDIVTDAAGRNHVNAGGGADVISVRNGKRDIVNCGPGKDRISADRGDRLKNCEKVRRAGGKKRKRRR